MSLTLTSNPSPREKILATVPNGFLCLSKDLKGEKQIDLPPGMTFGFTHEEDPKRAQHVVVAAPSGEGKSTIASEIIDNFPGKRVVISLDPEEDPRLKNVDDRVTPTIEDLQVPISELATDEGTFLIFDDCEGLPDKKLEDALVQFHAAALSMGRKHGIRTITCRHVLADGAKTRMLLREMTHLIFMPTQADGNIRYVLKHHLGLPDGVPEVLKDFGKEVMICRREYPQVIVGRTKACLLDHGKLISQSKLLKKGREEPRPQAEPGPAAPMVGGSVEDIDLINRMRGVTIQELQHFAEVLHVDTKVINVEQVRTARQVKLIADLLRGGTAVILFLRLRDTNTVDNPAGHFVSLIPLKDGTLEFFDPAGKKPEFYRVLPAWVHQIAQPYGGLTYFNQAMQPLQTNSCGAWNLIRIASGDMSKREFIRAVINGE